LANRRHQCAGDAGAYIAGATTVDSMSELSRGEPLYEYRRSLSNGMSAGRNHQDG
jgi:hypothetical protein